MEIVKVNVARKQMESKILVLDGGSENIADTEIEAQAKSIVDLFYHNLQARTWRALVQKITKEFNSLGVRN